MQKLMNILVLVAVLLMAGRMQGALAFNEGMTGASNVKTFGAKGDGKTNDSAAIQAAIDDLPDAGGIVRIPPETYLVNAIRLKSGTTLVGPAGRRC